MGARYYLREISIWYKDHDLPAASAVVKSKAHKLWKHHLILWIRW